MFLISSSFLLGHLPYFWKKDEACGRVLQDVFLDWWVLPCHSLPLFQSRSHRASPVQHTHSLLPCPGHSHRQQVLPEWRGTPGWLERQPHDLRPAIGISLSLSFLIYNLGAGHDWIRVIVWGGALYFSKHFRRPDMLDSQYNLWGKGGV